MDDRPAVVLSLLDDVDFVSAAGAVKTAWSMFSLEHEVRLRLPVQALSIAMSNRPELRSRVLLAHEGIVLRNSAVVVQAQRLARERVELLSELTTRCISGGDVELAVGTKANPAARVKLRRGQIVDDHGAID